MDYNFEREKNEAIQAGERALVSLREADNQLNSAKNWGVVDLLGGGLFTDLMKHSKMGNARECLEQAKRDLQGFSRELQDVNISQALNLNTGDFLTFADFFFDGLIADWLMQDRINDARRQVENAIRRVEEILRNLRMM
ncbi:MAG: hypothetical protein PUB19_01545 [Lachnospiraceae bacterium]|nr:hypothetical protein [Lachnospiraceae bacterium]